MLQCVLVDGERVNDQGCRSLNVELMPERENFEAKRRGSLRR
jgi:hypothetical protein